MSCRTRTPLMPRDSSEAALAVLAVLAGVTVGSPAAPRRRAPVVIGLSGCASRR